MARTEAAFGGVQEGLRVAKQEDHRVLYVLEVVRRVKQAVIVHDGPATEGAGGSGWYVESWAHCDYSELPAYFTDSIGLQIWTDPSGHPAPTSVIAAWKGPEHCGWQSMTFLELGQAVFVRNPQPELAEFFAEQYDEHAQLPADAATPDTSATASISGSHWTSNRLSSAQSMTSRSGPAPFDLSDAHESHPAAAAARSEAAEFRTGFRRIAPLDQP